MKTSTSLARTAALAIAALLAGACGPNERVPGPVPHPAPLPGPGTAEPPVPPIAHEDDRDLTVSPTQGTVETAVTLRGEDFPPNTALELGFGPPESEYEVFGEVTTDAEGSFTTTVTPPDWAEVGRDYVFVAVGFAGDEVVSGRFFVHPR